MNFLTMPMAECWDPEIATHLDCDDKMVYLNLGCTQYLQIFKSTYSFTKETAAYHQMAREAFHRHIHTINHHLENSMRWSSWDRHEDVHGEGEDHNNPMPGLPHRTMAGFEQFKRLNPYITDNLEPGILYLKGRKLKHILPRWVEIWNMDGSVSYTWEGLWLSEVALGFQVCKEFVVDEKFIELHEKLYD